MEAWEEDFAFQRVRHIIKERFDRPSLPDMNAILFLIGVQELGRWRQDFSKEEKQDLMHVAVCRLLSEDGHYEFVGRDDEGWPHYRLAARVPRQSLAEQEALLRRRVIEYFDKLEAEEGFM